ncbi:MAG: DUF3343 domain-containing protein [Tissierellia bacterium]|nr:DUF3343 domain-containing protein [Tissierellia bacterium]
MEKTLVITFKNTTSAMKMEQIVNNNNIQAEMIPIPEELEAGCGLSWKAYPKDKDKLIEIMDKENIDYDKIVEFKI